MRSRGAAVLSLDTERMWGYFDLMDEVAFHAAYPGAVEIHDRLLDLLCSAGVSATWAVVGALALERPDGGAFASIPESWRRRIPARFGRSDLWVAREFLIRLRNARVRQEIGLHGGLTHMPWGVPGRTVSEARAEIDGGVAALESIGVTPRSFVYPRDLVAFPGVLREAGIRCYRGRAPILSEKFGFSRAGSCIRAVEELAALRPPAVEAAEALPGLWNLPASMPLYSMTRSRCRIVPLRLRLDRVRLGLEEAARRRGVFHLCTHPENLAQSPEAFGAFESIVHEFVRWRDKGDLEIATMDEIACPAPKPAMI